jgi:alkanesulfonate monooxygenase SsuD/methylene tetrahydromethanopterin reductase-like flavin-dependent oxidoreductase (luciferase family)
MRIGIGLPNTLRIDGPAVVQWARRAEERGFSALATIDRIVYPSYDSITALAAAAGATSRIELFPDILLGPAYPPVWLAKAAASLDALSGGRLVLGLGVGGRPDDFEVMQRPFQRRGRLLDEALDLMQRAWAGEPVTGHGLPIGPAPADGKRVTTLIGGGADAAVRRTVRYADGWTAGGVPPEAIAPMVTRVREAWREAGREGEPRIAALVYFGLSDPEASKQSLRQYYAFLGEWGERIAESAVRSPDAAREVAKAFENVGVTDLVFDPTVADVDEVDRLADAVLR